MADQHTVANATTQEKIKAAFVELLQENDYIDITVREIATQANVGFKTLYRHYSDKTSIANEIYEEIWGNLIQQMTEFGADFKPENNIRHLLMTIQANLPLFRAFVALGSYQEILPESAINYALYQVKLYRPDIFESNHPYAQNMQSLITTYFMSGQIELVKWWIIEDKTTLPIEEMISMMIQLVIKPILSIQFPNPAE